MVVDYLSSQPNRAGYQVSTKKGSGPTDENGFILTGANILENRKNVFCIGGSFVESSFAQPHERFVARAASTLDANVFNAGYSGTTLLQACVMIMTKLPTIAAKGDLIVLFSSQSD